MANVWFVITIVVGLLFYVLRCRGRLYYGLAELAVALTIMFLTFHPPAVFLIAEESSWWGSFLSTSVGLLAGIYAWSAGWITSIKDCHRKNVFGGTKCFMAKLFNVVRGRSDQAGSRHA
jgi:hypothetical protein